MRKLVLYCKSYSNDVLRVKRLAESIQKFNHDNIPFYISIPAVDASLFKKELADSKITFINDEDIILANKALNQKEIDALPGGLSQQIIKSEFWRLNISKSYLCIDSDCLFIRSFCESDFITQEGYPYTIVHQGKELLQFAIRNDMIEVVENFHKERRAIMNIFGRTGHHYDFGPAPLLWSRYVWAALDENFLKPRQMNLLDAIKLFPSEILWYGEAMLKYRPIPVIPVESFFKAYLYERQFIVSKQQGETIECLAKDYWGVCYQSNWERQSDLVQKPFLSRLARWIRRNVFRRYS